MLNVLIPIAADTCVECQVTDFAKWLLRDSMTDFAFFHQHVAAALQEQFSTRVGLYCLEHLHVVAQQLLTEASASVMSRAEPAFGSRESCAWVHQQRKTLWHACRNKMISVVTTANGSLLLLSVPRLSQTAKQQ